jgi:uncharacterized damage-inducible protein DinB
MPAQGSGELAVVLRLIEDGYDKRAWHGSNLKGSIRRVDADLAARRPGDGRHNIWEHVLHAAYWKYVVRRRLLGEKRGSFPLKGSDWFVRPDPKGVRGWEEDVALLEEVHQSLRAAVAGLDPKLLDHTPPTSKVSNRAMLTGIAFHDVYHAAQIQLIKRLVAT